MKAIEEKIKSYNKILSKWNSSQIVFFLIDEIEELHSKKLSYKNIYNFVKQYLHNIGSYQNFILSKNKALLIKNSKNDKINTNDIQNKEDDIFENIKNFKKL